jgi:uncharacterized protein (TIGR03067 family)
MTSLLGSRLLYARTPADKANLGRRQHALTPAADGANAASRIRRVRGISRVAPDQVSSWWMRAVSLLTLAGVTLVVSPEWTARSARAEEGGPAAEEKDPATAADAETSAKQPAGEPPFRLFDGFDGKLALDWEVVRPNPDHASLTKNPGRLTITSELGGLFSAVRTGVSAKNVYLVPNPAIAGDDFVVTTCLERFHPEAPYQQAGPHIYDDDDNYLKAIIARNLTGVLIGCAWEEGGDFGGRDLKADDIAWDRLWLRIIKRGKAYESSYSRDGKKYTVIAERLWGDGSPQRIGLAVMNEDASPAPLDAAFDFFEVRSLTDEEKNDPVYLERRKLQGTWEVVSARLGGKPMEESPWSRFEFHGTEVTFSEKGQDLASKYALDPEKEPKGLTLTGVSRDMWKGHTREFGRDRSLVSAVYSIEPERLVICMDPRPGAPAPTELETKEGDDRMLVELRRMSDVEIAAIERSSQSAKQLVDRLDADHDGQLTLEEFTSDWPTPEAAKQGTEVFQVVDQDGDGKVTVDELNSKPMRAIFLLMDFNADGAWSPGEFSLGPVSSASAARTRRVFELVDQDHDGAMSFQEYTNRPAEAWFVKLDANDDDRLSLAEYGEGNPALVRSGRIRGVFSALDRNGDGTLSHGEFADKPQEALFKKLDADADGKLTFREFCLWRHTPDQVAAAKEEFGRKDADGDGLLSFKEYAYRPKNAEFWKADQDGDARLSLDEFKAGGLSEKGDRAEADFNSIDQNHDRSICLGEFETRPAKEKPTTSNDAP